MTMSANRLALWLSRLSFSQGVLLIKCKIIFYYFLRKKPNKTIANIVHICYYQQHRQPSKRRNYG